MYLVLHNVKRDQTSVIRDTLRLEPKILNGLERLAESLKALLWEKAKAHGISPIQIQILLFVPDHHPDLSNVSNLAKEFNVTKATISDAVKVLLQKGLLEKDLSPVDNRRYNLAITPTGKKLVNDLSEYSLPVQEEIGTFEKHELASLFRTLSKLIYQLNQSGVIQVQRTCYTCAHYRGDRKSRHYCALLETKLKSEEIRLDCPEFEK